MALTLRVCPGDSSAVVWASGDVDTNVAEVFRDMMLRVMRRDRHSPSLLLDLSGVSFMDCAGLRALLMTRRLAAMRGGSVCLIAESPAVHRIIDLLGVRNVFPVRERLAELSAVLLSLLGEAELHHYRSVERSAGFRPGPAAGEEDRHPQRGLPGHDARPGHDPGRRNRCGLRRPGAGPEGGPHLRPRGPTCSCSPRPCPCSAGTSTPVFTSSARTNSLARVSSPPRPRRTPTAAPAARRRRSPSSGSWTSWPPNSAWIRWSCGSGTGSATTSFRTPRSPG
jgi:anti-sigma B factor antagonist